MMENIARTNCMSKYRNLLPQLQGGLFLTDGGIETTLIFHEALELPDFAAFRLLETPKGEEVLRKYFNTYADLAKRLNTGLILESATWRASADWGTRLGCSATTLANLNRQAINLLEPIREAYQGDETPVVISGGIGLRGDGYLPDRAMNERTANVMGGRCGADHRHVEQIALACAPYVQKNPTRRPTMIGFVRQSIIAIFTLYFCGVSFALSAPRYGPGEHSFSVWQFLRRRTYHLHVPPAYDGKRAVPLLIALHGGGGDGKGMQQLSAWDTTADKEGFIVAYPDGSGRKFRGKTVGSWNGGRCCPPASKNKTDDVGFIRKLIAEVSQNFSIDEGRIYATGHSNGGIMAYRLACDLSDKIAAIGPMGGQGVFENCDQKRAVSILHIHGTEDRCAQFNGGTCGGCFERYLREIYHFEFTPFTWSCDSISTHIEYWRRKYDLPPEARLLEKREKLACLLYGPGKRGEEVQSCVVDGMGHSYPGGAIPLPCRESEDSERCRLFREILGPSSTDIEPRTLLWNFFKRHAIVNTVQ